VGKGQFIKEGTGFAVDAPTPFSQRSLFIYFNYIIEIYKERARERERERGHPLPRPPLEMD